MKPRTGIGFDTHPLVEGRPMIVGGVEVPSDHGPLGHSDGDVLAHADHRRPPWRRGVGRHRRPTSPPATSVFKGIASTDLLRTTLELLSDSGCRATYVDATVILERPVLRPYVDRIALSIAGCLGLDREMVNVKATTTDGLGFTGRGEGISAIAVATVESIQEEPAHAATIEAAT